jgi:endonuclease YncB( thermonuclease family)
LVLALATSVHAAELIIGKVAGVTDGDTIKVPENHTLCKIRKLESQARAEKIGLWSHPNPMPSWELGGSRGDGGIIGVGNPVMVGWMLNETS